MYKIRQIYNARSKINFAFSAWKYFKTDYWLKNVNKQVTNVTYSTKRRSLYEVLKVQIVLIILRERKGVSTLACLRLYLIWSK